MFMYSSVFSKTLLDRWRGITIAAVSISALLYFGLIVYQDIDLSIYSDLGPAIQSLIGIGEAPDVASLAYNAIYASYGGIVMAALAVSMGAGLFAGEEAKGTIGVLLANPRSRTQVLLAKAAAMLALIAVAGLILWGVAEAAPKVLDISVEGMHVGALTLHMIAIAVFFAFLALAIGAWTGRPGSAAGIGAGVLAVSFVGVGIVQVIDGWEDLAKIFPWYYFTGSDPLLNGIDWAHIAILGGASAALFAVALVGVNRRDLRSRSTGTNLLDRLRSNPRTAKLGEALAGSAQVSRIWVKTASENRSLLLIVSTAMFLVMGVLMGFVWNAMSGSLGDLGDALPPEMVAFFGGGDLSTPQGFYQIESFGMVTPIALLVVTLSIASKAVAGEEANRTIGVLLANPVSRSKVLGEKTFTMVAFAAILGFFIWAGVALGVVLAGIDEMNIAYVAATTVLAVLIGLLFGSLGLLIGAATGKVGPAVFIPVGAALFFHVLNALAAINDAWWGALSPFHYYLGSDPLNTGMHWGNAALLAGIAVALAALAFPAFNRRDLRQH